MDPLSDVLSAMRLDSAILASFSFSAPWGVDCESLEVGAPFHAVTSGACWLTVAGDVPIRLDAGDVVILPRWTRHVLSFSPDAHVVSIVAVFAENNVPVVLPPEEVPY